MIFYVIYILHRVKWSIHDNLYLFIFLEKKMPLLRILFLIDARCSWDH